MTMSTSQGLTALEHEQECLSIMLEAFFHRRVFAQTLQLMFENQHATHTVFLEKVSLLLKHPITISFNEHGLVPFHQDPTFVLPYIFMTPEQLQTSIRLLDLLADSSLTQQCQHDTGQNYVFLSMRKKSYLNVEDVLFTLAVLLHNTFTQTDYDANAMLNVVMQRVQNLVFVDESMWNRVVMDFKAHCAAK